MQVSQEVLAGPVAGRGSSMLIVPTHLYGNFFFFIIIPCLTFSEVPLCS